MLLIITLFFFVVSCCSWVVFFSVKKGEGAFYESVRQQGERKVKFLLISTFFGGSIFVIMFILNLVRLFASS